jgi:phage protein D
MPETLIVNCTVRIDGSSLAAEWAARLARVSVEQRLEAADRFTLLVGEDGLRLFDAEIFVPGSKIVIDCDPNPTGEPLIKGEVTAATPELVAGKPATLLVEGYDGSFRHSREKKRRTFLDMSAGDIVRQIGSDMGLQVEAEDGDHLEYMIQDNVSDMAFLWSLARPHRFEVNIDNERLRFGPPAERGDVDTTFERGVDLLHFVPRQSAARQPTQVIVKGWDPIGKKAVIGKAGTGDEEASVGRGQRAGDAVSQGFGDAPATLVERPVQSEREAEQLAKRLLSELAMDFLKCEATVPGNPAVRPGRLVTILGVGEQYEGEYYVYKTSHLLSGRGYVTRFWAKRNALDEAQAHAVEAEEAEQAEEQDHWVEVQFEDPDGNPVAVGDYVVRAPDGSRFTGTVGDDGRLRHDGMIAGDCQIGLKLPQKLRWTNRRVLPDEEATLEGQVPGAAGESVTVELFQYLREKENQILDSVTAEVDEEDRFRAAWTPSGLDDLEGWTEFIARVKAGDSWAKSPPLVVGRRGLRNLRWSVEKARSGDTVELVADAVGFPDGTSIEIAIWESDETSADDKIADLEPGEVRDEKLRARWSYEYHEDEDEASEGPYSPPEYYFALKASLEGEEYTAKSNLLRFRDHVDVTLVDPDGVPFPHEPYTLELPDGSLREGTLDAEGKAVERDVPPGRVLIRFPRLAEGGAGGAGAEAEDDSDEDVESRE